MRAFRIELLKDLVCTGFAVVIFPTENLLMTIDMQKVPVRSPDEPKNETIIRGSHEGFVESVDMNVSLLRKKIHSPDLVVKKFKIGLDVKSNITIVYMQSMADPEVISLLEKKIKKVKNKFIVSSGLVEDYLEENAWSPFPQFLNTERPDRVFANLNEGKIAVFTDESPSVLITTTFFSFYQTVDDFNSRSLIGSFYRIVRLLSFFIAVLLPGFYIAVVSYHPEILPIELSRQIKMVVNEIPYRPISRLFYLS